MHSQSVYSLDDLKKIMSACFVMAIVDEHIHDNEVDVIFAFIEKHWQKDYGELKQLADSANKRSFDILHSASHLDILRDKAKSLAGTLDAHQKEGVLSLLASVMTADGQEGKRELQMFKVFLGELYDPESISKDSMKKIISILLL